VPATNEEAITYFGSDTDGARTMTSPPYGTPAISLIYKEYYGTGWQSGLVTNAEWWYGGVKQKGITTTWMQDNTSKNPRVTETNVSDAALNHRRTTIDYHTQFGLPLCIAEYAADGSVIRFTVHHYMWDDVYLSRRIIGLPASDWIFDGSWQLYSKTTYSYDWPWEHMQDLPAAPTQHDANYNLNFVSGRGNLIDVLRWDVTDPDNGSKALEFKYGYNIVGAVTFTRDHLWHQNFFNYADSFSDGVNRNTFAYPTAITDGDWNNSSVQYNFDMGVAFRAQGPPPTNPATNQPYSSWAAQKNYYDAAGRSIRVVNEFNNAYRSFYYDYNYVLSYASVNSVADEGLSLQYFDGHDRVFAALVNHPGSAGGYSGQWTIYDVMGRVWNQSTPTEINGGWAAVGDDATSNGTFPRWTQQTYDWKSRPLVTTNADGTQRSASYSGCGCAGGEVVTLTDEVGRQQKVYSDVLGRQWKTEVMNGASVYSASVNVLNARDQVIRVKQYAGAAPTEASSTNAAASCPSGTCQETLLTYDPYGRLQTKHVPEQQVDPNNSASTDHTTWTYNNDDTIQAVTDARGVIANFSYNNRHMVTLITYDRSYVPAGANVAAAANVSFAYDAAGNRTSMSDGLGSKDYSYDQLSRLQWENRGFNGVTNPNATDGKFKLSYDYNLAGELKQITDPTNVSINYAYDQTGRLSNVTGTNYSVTQFITGILYRAWGAPKQVSYGNGRIESASYNQRLQVTHFEGPGVISTDYQFNSDGTVSYSHDLFDNRFDRSYTYDNEARITAALSGPAARGLPDTTDRPYIESFSYDAFDHLTGRDTQHWSKVHGYGSSDSYTNNRRIGWTYDADGNLTNDLSHQRTYDAAGQLTLISSSSLNMNQYFDGDGQRVKMTEPNVATYYVRSSVLGGQVIEDVDGSGNKQSGYVYIGGKVVAEQASNGFVGFVHEDPSGVSIIKTNSTFAYSWTELDALRADVGTEGPYLDDPGYGGRGDGGPLYPGFGNVTAPSTGCTLDGVYAPCDWIARGLVGDTLALQMPLAPGKQKQLPIQGLGLGIYATWVDTSGKRPPSAKDKQVDVGENDVVKINGYIPSGHWEFLIGLFGPQKAVPQTPLTPEQRGMVRSEMEKLLRARKDCLDFLSSVLFTVAVNTQTPLYSSDFLSDPLKIFDAVASSTQKGFFLAPGQGAGGFAWGGLGSGTAKVTFDSISPTFSTGLLGLHETAHEAGSRVFTDQELGWAAYQVAWAQGYANVKPGLYPPPRTNDVVANSYYWDDRLFKACSPNQHK
jgi:YD repeat-containing protein